MSPITSMTCSAGLINPFLAVCGGLDLYCVLAVFTCVFINLCIRQLSCLVILSWACNL